MNRPIADVGRRVVVVAVDTLIPIAIAGIVWAALSFLDALLGVTVAPSALFLCAAVIAIGWVLALSAMQGGRGSPGMRLFGTRLIGAEDLRPIGFLRALVRNVVYFALCAVVIGFFTVLLDRSGARQGWHDRVAGSIMVQRPKRTPIMPQLPQTDRRASEWLAAMSQPSMGEPERITEVPIAEANHHMTTTDPPVRHSSLITFVPGVTLDRMQLDEVRVSPPPVPPTVTATDEIHVQHRPVEETTGRRRARLARREAIRYSDDAPDVAADASVDVSAAAESAPALTPALTSEPASATERGLGAMEDTVVESWFTDDDPMAIFRVPVVSDGETEHDDVDAVDDGVVNDRAVDDGAVDDGAMDDGAVSDGAVDDGAVDDGAVDDGAVDDGAVDDGAVSDSAVSDEVAIDEAVNDETVRDAVEERAASDHAPERNPAMPSTTPMPSRRDLPVPGGDPHGTGIVGLGAPTPEAPPAGLDESTAVNEAPAPKEARTINGVRAVATVVWDDGTQYRIYTRTVFGRNPTPRQRGQIATIVDTSLSLSKTHFEISRTEADRAEIIDLHSTNGVRLRRSGATRVLPPGEPFVLATGDIIEIGRRRARVEVIS